jgi:hypothetical protein
VNEKQIKLRSKSVKSIEKITKAMKMVAAAKLRRAQSQAEAARPYAERMARMLASLGASVAGSPSAPKLLVGTGADRVHLLVVVTAIPLLYFVVSYFARMETLHGFNLTFAGLAAGIAARFARNVWRASVAVVIAWGAMSIRTYWAEGQSEPALLFTLVGLFGIVGIALVGWFLRRRDYDRPWLVLGGVCMFVGLIALPLSPP